MHIILDAVSYAYRGKSAFTLGPLSLALDTGSITALIGSNGSGKTTLIKVLVNELVQFEGTYRIDDEVIADFTARLLHRYGIGYAPEQPVLEERLTGLETMHLLKEIHHINDSDFATQMESFGSAFQLGEWFATMPCSEYSQGMRKKTSLMIAFMGTPPYIIIDEPTNGLDPIAVFGLKKLLASRAAEGRGALVSSHILDFIERVADRVVILRSGNVAFNGTVERLLADNPGRQLDEIYYHLFMNGVREVPQ